MTQVFGPNGEVIPVTVVEAGPCVVLEVLPARGALKIGCGEVKKNKLKKPLRGYFDKLNLSPRKHIREIKFRDSSEYQPGQELTVSIFQAGNYVDISGISKGKGFAGMIKRWGASRLPMSHGHPEHRRPGSIGASATPSRVFRGKKMPGRMGGEKKTIQNLEVVAVRAADNLLLVKGALPGPRTGWLVIRKALKKKPKETKGKVEAKE